MSTWSEIYKKRVGDGYREYCKERYKPFIEKIVNIRVGNYFEKTVSEEGCGIGTFSSIISKFTCIKIINMSDIDNEMLNLASSMYPEFKNIIRTKDIITQNYNKIKKPDIIFSHGVLEHFPDEIIKEVIRRQLRDAKGAVIHYIPTHLYKTQSCGDERLLPLSYWYGLTKFDEVITFNDGKDAILIWGGETR